MWNVTIVSRHEVNYFCAPDKKEIKTVWTENKQTEKKRGLFKFICNSLNTLTEWFLLSYRQHFPLLSSLVGLRTGDIIFHNLQTVFLKNANVITITTDTILGLSHSWTEICAFVGRLLLLTDRSETKENAHLKEIEWQKEKTAHWCGCGSVKLAISNYVFIAIRCALGEMETNLRIIARDLSDVTHQLFPTWANKQ